jgi:ASC-1-like (ASCH) protein
MGLYDEYFHSVKNGKKIVEVRLNDEKRRKISIGDTIEFTNLHKENQKLIVEVTNLTTYNSFKEMYENVPLKDFDCDKWTIEDLLEGTYKIYSKQQEKEFGTLAINFRLLKLIVEN